MDALFNWILYQFLLISINHLTNEIKFIKAILHFSIQCLNNRKIFNYTFNKNKIYIIGNICILIIYVYIWEIIYFRNHESTKC